MSWGRKVPVKERNNAKIPERIRPSATSVRSERPSPTSAGSKPEEASGVTAEDLASVPPEHRPHTLLMRKVDYAPAVETTDGHFSKVEVRVMCIWRDGRPLPVTTLGRLSQGKMMGVAFNKDRTWVGSTGFLWPKD